MSQATPTSQETGTSDTPGTSGILHVLRNRNFLFLWIAQALSQTSQQVMNYVLLQQAFALSQSNTAVSVIMICFTLPAILFSSVAGVYVDRKQKRTVLTVTNGLRTITMFAYILFTGPNFGFIALTVVYVATLFFSSVGQFFNPAEGSAIPLLVRRDQLVAANSLFNLTFTASQFIGFLVLGPLLVKIVASNNDFAPIYIVMAVLFAICVLLTWMLPRDEQVRSNDAMDMNADGVVTMRERITSVTDDLKEGWQHIRDDKVIFAAIIQWSVAIAVLLLLGVIGPGFLEFELNLDPHDLYIVLLPGGVGLIVGVALVGRIANEHNRLRVINFAILGAGLALMLLASLGGVERFIAGLFERGVSPEIVRASVAPWLIVSMMTVAFGLGIINSLISVPAQTTLQDRSHDEIRARVFGAFYTIQNLIVLVPIILVGPLADAIGVVATLALVGLAVVGVAVWGIRRGLVMPPPKSV